jgi:hypothetical protein
MSGLPPEIDTSSPHTARIYDYFLGGKNHFAADREVAEKSLASVPSGRIGAREQRAFLGRAVRYLAGEAGIRQFLDTASHLNPEHDPVGVAAGVRAYLAGGVTVQARDSGEFAALAFRDLELVPPGVVSVSEWRPESPGPRPTLAEVSCYGGVGRKA